MSQHNNEKRDVRKGRGNKVKLIYSGNGGETYTHVFKRGNSPLRLKRNTVALHPLSRSEITVCDDGKIIRWMNEWMVASLIFFDLQKRSNTREFNYAKRFALGLFEEYYKSDRKFQKRVSALQISNPALVQLSIQQYSEHRLLEMIESGTRESGWQIVAILATELAKRVGKDR